MPLRLLRLLPVLVLAGACAGGPVVHRSAPEPVIAMSSAPSSGSTYAIAQTYNGKPVRWDACSTIHWTFDPAGAPTNGLTVVKQAIALVAKTTTTTWVYDGTVTAVPKTAWLPTHNQVKGVLVGWTNGDVSDLLHGAPAAVLGVTRTSYVKTNGNGRMIAAVVALDSTNKLDMNGPQSWRTVVEHELGHAMGLAHAGSSSELMHPTLGQNLSGYAAGDVEGLKRVGRASGCIT